MKCNIRGHDHELILVRDITQKGTGTKARLLGCPDGNYRWLVIGDELSRSLRFTKPRYGWKKDL